jgi:hypothetical protein
MFYILKPDSELSPTLELLSDYPDKFWVDGASKANVPLLKFRELGKGEYGDFLRPQVNIPLVSKRFIETLQTMGIDNFQVFPAEVSDPEGKQYFSFNVLGNVSCLDLSGSEYEEDDGDIEEIFSLVLDAERAADHHLFRLAEFPILLIASEQLKSACESSRIKGMKFISPEDWDGF